jgi:tRNA-dihydrouridine synthase A
VLEAHLPYVSAQRTAGVPLPQLTRHLLGLFTGRPGARRWRRHLTEAARAPGAGVEVLREALAHVRPADRAAA